MDLAGYVVFTFCLLPLSISHPSTQSLLLEQSAAASIICIHNPFFSVALRGSWLGSAPNPAGPRVGLVGGSQP